MIPCDILLILTFKIMTRTIHACGINWLSSFPRDITITDDVTINVFHSSMKAHIDLVEGLEYNVSVSGDLLRSSAFIYMIVHATSDQAANTDNHNLYSRDDAVVDVVEFACGVDNLQINLPITVSWTTPENITCSCIYLTSVIQVSDELLRTRPYTLCKATGCRRYYTVPSGVVLYNSSLSANHGVVNCSFIIIGGSNSIIDMQSQYVQVEARPDGRCDNIISISLGDVADTKFCGRLNTQELRQHNYVTYSGFLQITITVKNRHLPAVYIGVYSIYETVTDSGYNQTTGTITLASFQNLYPGGYHKVTRITLPPEFRISVQFMFLGRLTNINHTCSQYTFIFRDLVNDNRLFVCSEDVNYGTYEVTFESLSSEVEIELHSDSAVEGNGFQIFYKGTRMCHNQTLVGSFGTLSSLNYPFNYLSNQDCIYDVIFDAEDDVAALEVQFMFFHSESDQQDSMFRNALCKTDFLEIHSAGSTEKMCGDWRGKEHLLTLNRLFSPVQFRFVTNSLQTWPGFFATWRKVKPTRPVCSLNVVQTSFSRFEIFHSPQSWFDSELDCCSRGGHLAKIDDATTDERLQAHLIESDCQNLDAFWIGAHDLQIESKYFWSSGEKVLFFRWFPGWTLYNNYSQQPSDDGLSEEDCVEMRRLFYLPWNGTQQTGRYYWNDRACSEKNPYICRIDPPQGDGALKFANRIIEITENSTVDIYSINFPEYLSGDVTDVIILHAPIGRQIHISFIQFDVSESTYTLARVSFEDISLGSNKTELSEHFCFSNDNLTDDSTTAKHGHNLNELKEKMQPEIGNSREDTKGDKENDETRKDINNINDTALGCTWILESQIMDASVTSALNKIHVTIHSFAGSGGFRIFMQARAIEGPMCTQKLDEDKHEITLGQRLLKEPIWIGLIVILIVVTLIGITYMVRRRCGRYLTCREVKRTKDDTILNSDGTITLNSYPLRRVTRPSCISIISSSSPSFAHDVAITENDSPDHSPGIQIWNAAAKFFEAYKDTEQSLVSTPLTTDFSRTTDTSLSRDTGDAAVGAVVGGRLQLDLHLKENREQHEAMRRSQSLLQIPDKSRAAIKHSRSAENFKENNQSAVNGLCQSSGTSPRKEKHESMNDYDHLYPLVIVQSPNAMKLPKDECIFKNEQALTKVPEIQYIDSSGAHILEISIEDNSEDTDGLEMGSSETEYDGHRAPHWRIHSHSADSIHRLEHAYCGTTIHDERMIRDMCDYDFTDRNHKALAQASSAVMNVQNELRKRDRCSKISKRRQRFCFPNKATRDTDLIRPTHALMEDHEDFSDAPRKYAQISNKKKLFSSSFHDLINPDTHHNHPPFSDRNHTNCVSCDCPACWFNRSESLTSNVSSTDRCVPTLRDKYIKHPSSKDRRKRLDAQNVRSYSTISDQTAKHSKRRRNGGSYRHRHKQHRTKQGSSIRSQTSVHVHYSSSTDSDLLKMNSRHQRYNKKIFKQHEDKKDDTSQSAQDEASSSSRVGVPETLNSDTVVKDLFQKVFSQEIDLDDISLPEDDDNDFMIKCSPNSKDNFLASEPQVSRSSARRNSSEQVALAINCDTDKVMDEDGSQTASLPMNVQRKCSIVTMLAGSPEVMSVSKRPSLVPQEERDTTVSSDSSGTPTTCNVIMYDSNRRLDNHDKPPTIKTHFHLTRKHSSLDLVEPLKLLPSSQQTLRTASSMHELYDIPHTDHDDQNYSGTFIEQGLQCSKQKSANRQILHDISRKDVDNETLVSHSTLYCQENPDVKVDNYVDNSSSLAGGQQDFNTFVLSSSPENFRWANRKSNHDHSYFVSTSYLSVTDTDSALSSAPSPQNTPNICQKAADCEFTESRIKDSAYQTKQSSVEVEALTDVRVRRQILPIREEDRNVTQRLHQAAIKLLLVQQRLRRARQNISKDSAVHTISEDDAALDDITITSPAARAFKPGVLYPVLYKDDQAVPQFSPLQYSKIIEEHDPVMEYEV